MLGPSQLAAPLFARAALAPGYAAWPPVHVGIPAMFQHAAFKRAERRPPSGVGQSQPAAAQT